MSTIPLPVSTPNSIPSMPPGSPRSTTTGNNPSPVGQFGNPKQPTIVGVYGISGCGKSHLLNELRAQLKEADFAYYEGAVVIDSITPGGLKAFKQLDEPDKKVWREKAIDKIAEECSISTKVGIIAGHLIFWDKESDECGQLVWTEHDAQTFTHILYLDIPAGVVASRRICDSQRTRPSLSKEHLQKWAVAECTKLQTLCLNHGIIFATVTPSQVSALVQDIQRHTIEYNLLCAGHRLDDALKQLGHNGKLESMLVMDGDRTLIAGDTGAIFWKLVSGDTQTAVDPLREVFSSQNFGYSYAAFRQAALLYEVVGESEFNIYCEQVASMVTIHPELVSLLKEAEKRHIGAVVLTCGVSFLWEKILDHAGLSNSVKVIGGGRTRDRLVVTADVKGALIARLKAQHRMHVCAFGDSPLDLPMLKAADRAIIVVGEAQKRSSSMDEALSIAIDQGLRAYQVLLPKMAPPRLDTAKLPIVDVTETSFLDSLVSRKAQAAPPRQFRILDATNKNSAKLLMTPTRDSRVAGYALRKAHSEIGKYLATEFLAELVGLEEYSIPHVQGNQTIGHRFCGERETLIIALMRGGEPMALGVNEAMPLAGFLHAKVPQDVQLQHVEGKQIVILVDSVINSGRTIIGFTEHIHSLSTSIHLLVVAGVIQSQSLLDGTRLSQILSMANVGVVALRISDNNYPGRGTTDTGNRLFNTTHLQ